MAVSSAAAPTSPIYGGQTFDQVYNSWSASSQALWDGYSPEQQANLLAGMGFGSTPEPAFDIRSLDTSEWMKHYASMSDAEKTAYNNMSIDEKSAFIGNLQETQGLNFVTTASQYKAPRPTINNSGSYDSQLASWYQKVKADGVNPSELRPADREVYAMQAFNAGDMTAKQAQSAWDAAYTDRWSSGLGNDSVSRDANGNIVHTRIDGTSGKELATSTYKRINFADFDGPVSYNDYTQNTGQTNEAISTGFGEGFQNMMKAYGSNPMGALMLSMWTGGLAGAAAGAAGVATTGVAGGALQGAIGNVINQGISGESFSLTSLAQAALMGGVGGLADDLKAMEVGGAFDPANIGALDEKIWNMSDALGMDYNATVDLLQGVANGVISGGSLEDIALNTVSTWGQNQTANWMREQFGDTIDIDNWFREGDSNIPIEAVQESFIKMGFDGLVNGGLDTNDALKSTFTYFREGGDLDFLLPALPYLADSEGLDFFDINFEEGDWGVSWDGENNDLTFTGNIPSVLSEVDWDSTFPDLNFGINFEEGDWGASWDNTTNELTFSGNVPEIALDMDWANWNTPDIDFSGIDIDLGLDIPEFDLDLNLPDFDLDLNTPELPDLGLNTPELPDLDLNTPELPDLDLNTPELPDLDLNTPELPEIDTPELDTPEIDTPELPSLDLGIDWSKRAGQNVLEDDKDNLYRLARIQQVNAQPKDPLQAAIESSRQMLGQAPQNYAQGDITGAVDSNAGAVVSKMDREKEREERRKRLLVEDPLQAALEGFY